MSTVPFHIKFSPTEYELLTSACSYAELALYFSMKKRASFATGIVGGFRPLTYDALAKLISRPKFGDQPALVFDRSQARKLLLALETKKVVGDVTSEDGVKCKLIYAVPTRSKPSKAPHDGPPYYSFNSVEYELLGRDCSHADLALYFSLKKQADFRTGVAGQQFQLTWDDIARFVSRPSSQGVPAIAADEAYARWLMKRLSKVGLIEVMSEKPRLVCFLTHSTLHFPDAQDKQNQPVSLERPEAKLTHGIDDDSAVSQAQLGFARFEKALTVLAVGSSTDSPPQYQRNTSSVLKPEAQNTDQGALPPTARLGPTPALGLASPEALTREDQDLIKEYQKCLHERGDFEHVFSGGSMKNYVTWTEYRIRADTVAWGADLFRQAKPKGLLSPYGLAPYVFKAHEKQKKNGRYDGGVVL
ncbi:MAG: hypothetical protein V4542_18490 [Pseudomonadota bacterium]